MKRFRTILAAFVLTVIAGTSSMLAQTPDTAPEATGSVKMFGVPVTLPFEEFKAAVEQSPEFQAFKKFATTMIGTTEFDIGRGWTVSCSKTIIFNGNMGAAMSTLRDILRLKYGEPKERYMVTLRNNMVDRRGMVASSIGINAINVFELYWTIPGGEITLTNLRNENAYLSYTDFNQIGIISQDFFNGL